MTAYQEDLLSLDDLRRRMPELRKREQAIGGELSAIQSQLADRAGYLRLAETITSFLARLRATAKTLDVSERELVLRLASLLWRLRQRIVRLLVLEPIFEADFEDSAYGYRPRRGAGDALVGVEADTIPHAELLRCVARRIVDGEVLRLIRLWRRSYLETATAVGPPVSLFAAL